MLSKHNIAHIPVHNPRDALAYLSNPHNPRPNIIFLKMQIPVMSSKEFIHILRTKPPFANDPLLRATPVIGMDPGYSFRSCRDKHINEWGVDDAIPRPMKAKALQDVLLYWSRREVVPNQGPGGDVSVRPVWGPFPLRGYTGPRSLL
ncbi:hypothetical protein SI65_01983 [Aspergillus cristatus]|uniref:Response regulatory domain-containing protein n=1 Tax=Aspergillus cristatus TaxID=573508 RepID=A0A1E3BTM9_ASPCR|nr:hypothetical protein SI65_01899 [Aspergillus cristatus]ODM24393.1 hypothetical protein SI65_01983 [Aspergillus cristatus]